VVGVNLATMLAVEAATLLSFTRKSNVSALRFTFVEEKK
jgi:hypothetical protein